MLLDVEQDETAYILFNNLPRVGDAKRFVGMLKQDAE